MIQCVIFDGNANNAKIMGVEYIVSVLFSSSYRQMRSTCGTAMCTR